MISAELNSKSGIFAAKCRGLSLKFYVTVLLLIDFRKCLFRLTQHEMEELLVGISVSESELDLEVNLARWNQRLI